MKIGDDKGNSKTPFLEIGIIILIWLIALSPLYIVFLKAKIAFNF